jgi:hypothetical protein
MAIDQFPFLLRQAKDTCGLRTPIPLQTRGQLQEFFYDVVFLKFFAPKGRGVKALAS